MAEYTLDKAKRWHGWLPVDDETEASLDWTLEEGWILTFRNLETKEVTSTLRFHRERSLQGHSWPGGRPLSELALLSGDWSDHAPKRRRAPFQKTWMLA